MKNRFVCWLWALIYRKWMQDRTVIKVCGWRTALVEDVRWRNREMVTPIFWRFK